MGYRIRHLEGSSDEDAPILSFESLYDELRQADGEHTDGAVIDDDTGWCITAYASGLEAVQHCTGCYFSKIKVSAPDAQA